MTKPKIIDAHLHIWDRRKADYTWLTEDFGAINRDFDYSDAAPGLAFAGVDGAVLVQSADNWDDTALMLECARSQPMIVGIVGFAPLDLPRETQAVLTSYLEQPIVRGIRTLIHNQPDARWLQKPEVLESLRLVADAGLTYDVVAVNADHMRSALVVMEKVPDLPIVIDHLACPPLDGSDLRVWRDLFGALAENPKCFAKVSGLYPPSASQSLVAGAERVRPAWEFALERFSPDRLMYGGDWPISLLHGGYERTFSASRILIDELSAEDQASVLGASAERFYELGAVE